MTSIISKTGLKDQINKSAQRPKHKGGAPKKRIRREVHVKVRLTTTERFLIESKARGAGMRISDWVREAILKAKVMTRLTTEDRRVLHLLAGMANNLNQLTKLAHTSGIMSIAIKCGHLLTEIDQTLKYLNSDDGKNT
ncbi:plasmid mobilization relaxosome protein MobC [Pedobacter sp. ISL-68]|uniref:plasmid mobilization protein n=1 Tax=unclassified Pedobacter TaxID=2628915 RepID=UPI001BE697AA|nr:MULTISPECIES: plasmid mobilization relaxosome protein MobC [unclassified Pedobacter]MBT2561358.1 plasmid mobilization relaxosome protein MobC [Pedobacter sp. ISL-64]MBT2590747.1 plasmid mobilization relaxosome protein MobC [Pedobacter sp. ISL-68]